MFRFGKRKLNSKGFLGPIGDDLPSLIPILFALIVFFSVFSYSFDNFDRKTVAYKISMTGVSIARQIKGTSYLSGYCNVRQGSSTCDSLSFKSICDQIQREVKSTSFLVGLNELPIFENEDKFLEKLNNKATYPHGVFTYPIVDGFPFYNDLSDDDTIKAIFPDLDSTFICSSENFNNLQTVDPFDTKNKSRTKNVSFFTYPVALETARGVIPMRLIVVVWK